MSPQRRSNLESVTTSMPRNKLRRMNTKVPLLVYGVNKMRSNAIAIKAIKAEREMKSKKETENANNCSM